MKTDEQVGTIRVVKDAKGGIILAFPMTEGQTVGSYQILSKLGSGAMGEVYQARDLKLGRDVAIKVLPLSFTSKGNQARRLLREARLLAKLNHPHIAAIYSLERFDSVPALVLELIDGPTLANRIATGLLTVHEALIAADTLAQALAVAHNNGILHRDLKPENIKFTREGVLKVLDFGLGKAVVQSEAAAIDSARSTQEISTVGQFLGTPAYMSPEQARGKAVDKRSDIWSFGCVLYEMLTGQKPFRGDTLSDLIVAILHDQPKWDALPAEVPLEIRRLLEHCLQKDPQSRLSDFAEARNYIKNAVTQLPQVPTSKTADPAKTNFKQYGVRILSVVVVTVFIALPVATWRFRPMRVEQSIPSIAVLPLANLSNDSANAYLGIGVAETLLGNLASLSGVTVVSRPAVESKDRVRDVVRTAHDLGVSFVVDGSVQQRDEKMMVTVRLVRSDGVVVWGSSYEGPTSELFITQTKVAEGVSAALKLRLTQAQRAKLEKQPTNNLSAFADYSQARSLSERLDVAGNLSRAIELLQAAVEKDPNFAMAYAALGEAYWARYQQSKDADWTTKAKDATLQALRLDADQAAVRRSLALIYRGTGDTETAIQELRRALELQNSDDAHHMLGEILSDKGQIEDAIAEFDTAIALRPNFWGNYDAKGLALYRAGRFMEAAAAFERVTELQPDNATGFQRLGTAYHAAGNTDKALVNYRRGLDLAPSAKAYTNLGVFYHNQSRLDDAANAYSEALRLDPTSQIAHSNLGDVYERLGRAVEAQAEYRSAFEIADRMLRVNPKDPLALSQRAMYTARLGRFADAQRDADAAVSLAPGNGQVLYNKAVVHALSREQKAALNALRQALAHGASASVARQDDALRLIRSTPEFEQILR